MSALESDWEGLKGTLLGQQNKVMKKQGSFKRSQKSEEGPIDKFINNTRKANMQQQKHKDFIKDLRLNNNSNVMDISELTGRTKNETKSSNLNDKDSSMSERDKNQTPTSKKSEKGLFHKPSTNFIKNMKNKNRPPLKVNSFKKDTEEPTKSPNSQYSKIRVENIKQKKSKRKLFDLEKEVEELSNQTPLSSGTEEEEERTIPSTKFYPKSTKNAKKEVKGFGKQRQMVKTPTSSNLNKAEIPPKKKSKEISKKEVPNGSVKQDNPDDVRFLNNEEIAALLRERIKPVLGIIGQLEKLRKINLKPQKELFNKQIKAVINKIK